MKAYLSRFNEEHITMNDLDEKITLVALLGDIWPKSPFMAELARRTFTTLGKFMDQVSNFVNAEDTLQTLTTPRRSELEWSENEGTSVRTHEKDSKTKKGQYEKRKDSSTPSRKHIQA